MGGCKVSLAKFLILSILQERFGTGYWVPGSCIWFVGWVEGTKGIPGKTEGVWVAQFVVQW